MDIKTFNACLIAPVFYYLGFILYLLSAFGIYAALSNTPAFLVLACILFVTAHNSFRFGKKLRDEAET